MPITRSIDEYEDIIDSRDVIARIEELESDREAVEEDPAALVEWDVSEDAAELKKLKALEAEAGGYAPDWHHGETLIRDSYFEQYAQELADDIGALDGATKWPLTCIDWAQAARELQQDYTCVSFGGVDYWIRS